MKIGVSAVLQTLPIPYMLERQASLLFAHQVLSVIPKMRLSFVATLVDEKYKNLKNPMFL